MTLYSKIKYIMFAAVILLLSACGGGGGGGNTPKQSNTAFVAKVKALSLNEIRLFKGHLNNTSIIDQPGLDLSNLNSGDLITINIEFEITGDLTDYSLTAQLVPQSVYSLFSQGTTVGEIFNNADGAADQEFVDLGATYISQVTPGVMYATIHTKLPVLKNDETFKVVVSPSIDYLSADNFIDADVETMPMLVDNTELMINKLAEIKAGLAKAPNIILDNDFTALEEGQLFDSNGFSEEPIFESSVNVDLSSFNAEEKIATKIYWVNSKTGVKEQMGLLNSNYGGTPSIASTGFSLVKIPTAGKSSMLIPVSAHIPQQLYAELLAASTNIRDIADTTPRLGHFVLNVAIEDSVTGVVNTGTDYNMYIPLVSQSARAVEKLATEVAKYTVLRAGDINAVCLATGFPDIENGGPDNYTFLSGTVCDEKNKNQSWRYDPETKQIVLEYEKPILSGVNSLGETVVVESESYCLSFTENGNSTETYFEVQPCLTTGLGFALQQFVFKDSKIRWEYGEYYLSYDNVNSSKFITQDATLATNYYTDPNGIDVDPDGRVFSTGKDYSKQWGDADIAQVKLEYGGESYIGYIPVAGVEAKGHVLLTGNMLGRSKELINASFHAGRYMEKKISLTTNNYPDKQVANGAELIVKVFGDETLRLGSIALSTVTDTVNVAQDSAANLLSNNFPIFQKIKPSSTDVVSYTMDQDFLVIQYPVVGLTVKIEGGVRGNFLVTADLGVVDDASTKGISVSAGQTLAISGYLKAVVDAYVLTGVVQANLELINQNILFTTNHSFWSQGALSLDYNMDASLAAALKIIKGDIGGYVEYTVPRWGVPPWKKKRHDFTIFETDYLYNKEWDIFNLTASKQLLL